MCSVKLSVPNLPTWPFPAHGCLVCLHKKTNLPKRDGTLSEETESNRCPVSEHKSALHAFMETFFWYHVSKTVCHSMVSGDTDLKREETRERKPASPPLHLLKYNCLLKHNCRLATATGSAAKRWRPRIVKSFCSRLIKEHPFTRLPLKCQNTTKPYSLYKLECCNMFQWLGSPWKPWRQAYLTLTCNLRDLSNPGAVHSWSYFKVEYIGKHIQNYDQSI